MTIAQGCLIFAALMLVLSKMPLMKAQSSAGGYDNHNPRDQQARLTGWGRRALAAHQNMFEAFPLFAAGVLMAQSVHAPQFTVDMLALVFVAARVGYQLLYLLDLALPRSLSWGVGFFASLALLSTPAWVA